MADASRSARRAPSAPVVADARPAPVLLPPFARAAHVPLHHQIAEDLVLTLNSGRFLPGAALPGEAALCAHYRASRGTIRHALAELGRHGLIDRHVGRGSFLRRPKIEGNIVGSYRQFRVEGPPLDPGGRVLSLTRRRADANVAGILGLRDNRSIFVLKRLRFAGGMPVTVQTSYLPAALCPSLPRRRLDERHLVDILLEEHGVAMTRAEELIEPGIASAYDAAQLGIRAGVPVFQIERRTYLADGRIGEFRRAVMRGDVYRYRLDLR